MDHARARPEIRSKEWYDIQFAPYKDSEPPPADLRALSERFCDAYKINGMADPMYVVNCAAWAFERGDGCGNFVSNNTHPDATSIKRLSERLSFAYSSSIANSGATETPEELIHAALIENARKTMLKP